MDARNSAEILPPREGGSTPMTARSKLDASQSRRAYTAQHGGGKRLV